MKLIYTLTILVLSVNGVLGQTVLNSLAELRAAVQNSNQNIILEPGSYNIETLPSNQRFFDCTGSNNTIDLTDVYIEIPVDATSDQHFLITGSDNTLLGGILENTYADGTEEITDYVAYNNDRNNFANGGDPHIVIQGDGNTVIGMKMTVRGSFPYGYGSIYGINNNNVFGLVKRGGIAVQGTNAVIDGVELQMRAFGHAIYIQSPSNHTIIKNTVIIGDVRLGSELIAETDPSSLPYRSDFQDFSVDHENPDPIDPNRGISLCEDGIRLYRDGGSMHVENCRVEKMRGGIRGYLGSGTTIVNSVAIHCESTNFNLPSGGSIEGSSGNFSYCPLSDYRLGRNNTNVELTIIPSPHASGSHNLLDLQGSNHDITLHRTPGPLDSDEERAIVITGDNSTILNETEYTIIVEAGADGNDITSCGPVINNGSGNTIKLNDDCDFIVTTPTCTKNIDLVQAECYDDSLGVQIEDGTVVAFIENGDWTAYTNLDLSDMNSVELTYSSQTSGGTIEFRLDAVDGILIGSLEVGGTGNWNNFLTASTNINRVEGRHDIYLLFTGEDGYLFNLDKYGFSEEVFCNNITKQIEAECFDDMFGIKDQNSDDGTKNIGWIENGDWSAYIGLDLTGMNTIDLRVACNSEGGTIEVRTGSETGTLIGSIDVTNTGGNQNWETLSASITEVNGEQDIYLVYTGDTGYLYNINWLNFRDDPSQSNEVTLDLKVFLESCYQGNGFMSNGLDAVIPIEEPYSSLGYTIKQGSASTLGAGVLSKTGVDKLIDWVVIELRDPSDITKVIESKVALLLADGDIVDLDGTSLPSITTTTDHFYVAIHQRNHLGVMSKEPINSSNGSVSIDFSEITNVYTDAEISNLPMKTMSDGKYVLYQGDVNGDGEINSSDASFVFDQAVPITNHTYHVSDVNMDSQLSTSDAVKVFENAVPVKREHIKE